MPRSESNYISYGEVMRALDDVSGTWGVKLQFVMGLTPQPCKGVDCYVRLAMFLKDHKGLWMDVGGVSHYWPMPDCATMTGLMLKMIYELDAKLQRDDELDKERKRATPLQLKF